jgi:pyruvate dehydrogenase E2 component (dihydrolipoamide acetyltransferase)
MATEITMPKLSDTMTEGTLMSWKKGVGEWVERGDILAEVETDKATMELEAFSSGILLETRVKAGEAVPVGAVIALIGAEGDRVEPREPIRATQEQRETAAPATDTGMQNGRPATHPREEPDQPEPGAPHPEKASPMVRRMARESGIDLALISGTGPDGRVTREDLEGFITARETQPAPAREAAADSGLKTGETSMTAERHNGPPATCTEPLSGMRAAIARTVSESWRTIPHFTVTVEIHMEAAEKLYHGFKDAGIPVSLNDIVIKAAAMALQGFPRLNASFTGTGISMHPDISIGIAVEVENGLLVPVIKGCEALSLREIGLRSRDLVTRARSGKISVGEISGGTFTVSNLGMFNIAGFTAIIMPPQTGILAVGGVSDRAVVQGDRVIAARMMQVTLSADHRAVDGAYAARFLAELKRLLENPVKLLV